MTVAAGVPTIWMALLPELRTRKLPALRILPCGGSAVAKSLSVAFREAVCVDHAVNLWIALVD